MYNEMNKNEWKPVLNLFFSKKYLTIHRKKNNNKKTSINSIVRKFCHYFEIPGTYNVLQISVGHVLEQRVKTLYD